MLELIKFDGYTFKVCDPWCTGICSGNVLFKSKCLISQTGPFPSKGIIGQPCLATILTEIWIYQISEEYLPKKFKSVVVSDRMAHPLSFFHIFKAHSNDL